MIEFEYKLPRYKCGDRRVGTYNNVEMVLPCALTTTDSRLGEFLHKMHNIIHDERTLVFIDGKVVMCCKNWIRDHVHDMKGFRHWEFDMLSFLQFILDTQRDDGCYLEMIKQIDDEHWSYVDENDRLMFPDDNLAACRLELEADIEYLVVEGAWQYYRTTGDFNWLKDVLPKLEKGIDYITSDPKRFSKEYGLVMRPFTIDTWDFTNEESSQEDRRIHDNEHMCIMHGDNSGVYWAMNYLAKVNERIGNIQKAESWKNRAEKLRENMFRYLWNGRFFMHQFHIGDGAIDDLESERLSLSNAYDLNRGVVTLSQGQSIIDEYINRRKTTKAFAEWFSIDPPYEQFMHYKAGRYVNGAISPFTAGELARAAFEYGREEYGWDIIQRFISMSEKDGTIYFLYTPEDASRQAGGPSAWGAAALLNAVDEGLAGIVDADSLYRIIDFSPRFAITDYTELRYITGYEVSHVFVDVRYIRKEEGLRYDIISKAERINAHIMLPRGKKAKCMLIDGKEHDYTQTGDYADACITAGSAVSIEIMFE